MGDTIIAIGGSTRDRRSKDVAIKTAECLVLGEDTWKELPQMHFGRYGATACLLP